MAPLFGESQWFAPSCGLSRHDPTLSRPGTGLPRDDSDASAAPPPPPPLPAAPSGPAAPPSPPPASPMQAPSVPLAPVTRIRAAAGRPVVEARCVSGQRARRRAAMKQGRNTPGAPARMGAIGACKAGDSATPGYVRVGGSRGHPDGFERAKFSSCAVVWTPAGFSPVPPPPRRGRRAGPQHPAAGVTGTTRAAASLPARLPISTGIVRRVSSSLLVNSAAV